MTFQLSTKSWLSLMAARLSLTCRLPCLHCGYCMPPFAFLDCNVVLLGQSAVEAFQGNDAEVRGVQVHGPAGGV